MRYANLVKATADSQKQSEQKEDVRNAMEEQGHGSKQILDNVGLINDSTQLVKVVSLEIFEGAKEVIHEADNLEKVTQEITRGVNDMASGKNQVNTAINHTNELSGKNHEYIGLLIKEVSRLKADC